MNGPLIEAIGSVAGTLTTLSFLPQVFKVVREHKTAGISRSMYAVFMVGATLWLIYGILIGSTPVIAANAVSLLLAGIVLVMKIRIDGFP
jgi:MtN3 and saliva related transmembrane protein